MISIRRATDGDKALWNDFVRKHEAATIFHLWEWGQLINKTFRAKRIYLIAEDHGSVVGVFPLLLVEGILFGRKLVSSPFCEYGGPLVLTSAHARSFLSSAMSIAVDNRSDYVEIRTCFFPSFDELIEQFGFKTHERYCTFKLGLSSSQNLWAKLDRKIRNAVRKAVKNDVAVMELKDFHELEIFYDLYLKTMKNLGSPPYPFSYFAHLWRFFGFDSSIPRVKFLIAEYRQKAIAGICVSVFKGDIQWWMSVSDPQYRNLNPTHLLLWSVLEWGADNKCNSFDFGRTRLNTGVYDFKKKWNGTPLWLRTYTHFFGEERELPDPTHGIYFHLSKLWSLLPIPLARKLGPRILAEIGL